MHPETRTYVFKESKLVELVFVLSFLRDRVPEVPGRGWAPRIVETRFGFTVYRK